MSVTQPAAFVQAVTLSTVTGRVNVHLLERQEDAANSSAVYKTDSANEGVHTHIASMASLAYVSGSVLAIVYDEERDRSAEFGKYDSRYMERLVLQSGQDRVAEIVPRPAVGPARISCSPRVVTQPHSIHSLVLNAKNGRVSLHLDNEPKIRYRPETTDLAILSSLVMMAGLALTHGIEVSVTYENDGASGLGASPRKMLRLTLEGKYGLIPWDYRESS